MFDPTMFVGALQTKFLKPALYILGLLMAAAAAWLLVLIFWYRISLRDSEAAINSVLSATPINFQVSFLSWAQSLFESIPNNGWGGWLLFFAVVLYGARSLEFAEKLHPTLNVFALLLLMAGVVSTDYFGFWALVGVIALASAASVAMGTLAMRKDIDCWPDRDTVWLLLFSPMIALFMNLVGTPLAMAIALIFPSRWTSSAGD